jgi:hypothetical protein
MNGYWDKDAWKNVVFLGFYELYLWAWCAILHCAWSFLERIAKPNQEKSSLEVAGALCEVLRNPREISTEVVRDLRRVRKIAKNEYLFYHVCLFVCPSAWNNSATTGTDFHDILVKIKKSVQQIQVSLNFDKNNSYYTLRQIHIFLLLYRAFW